MNAPIVDFGNLTSAADWQGSMHGQDEWEAMRLECLAEEQARLDRLKTEN
jgi:hypothetical protein